MYPTPRTPVNLANPVLLRGSCLCGNVGFSSSALPSAIVICHCVECRKASGNTCLTFGLFHNSHVEWTDAASERNDTPLVKVAAYSTMAVRGSCAACGTPLFMKYHCRPDGIGITMGLVDDQHLIGSMPEVKEHIFLKEKAAWYTLPSDHQGIGRHDGFNESFQARLREWERRGKPRRADVGLSSKM